ncbi:nuclear transport factor 2 family protein [Streptomyces sp. NRRL WC-3549]|uniref:nuclear transport factor 2 family protein n=1 Tax=Streptomyces sp. NRRL WC-3549 TaxID=1463925 RepID=UPI000AC8A644|nr:nuclear transport factor 2 family protein [Streptomyces sp. NRRL WC-3549]
MSEDRIAALEARLGLLEDERAVARAMASYGPLVDGGDSEGVAALWAPDGVYDIDEIFLAGRERVRGMVDSPAHRGWIRQGCAHVVGPPHITVDGDEAVAVCHSLMVVHEEGRYVAVSYTHLPGPTASWTGARSRPRCWSPEYAANRPRPADRPARSAAAVTGPGAPPR